MLQREGVLAYTSIEEGEITATRLAQLPDDVEANRVQFLQVRSFLVVINLPAQRVLTQYCLCSYSC